MPIHTLRDYEEGVPVLPEVSANFLDTQFSKEKVSAEVRSAIFDILLNIDHRDMESFGPFITNTFLKNGEDGILKLRDEVSKR